MINFILSILAPIWQYIAGGLILLIGGWLWKRKNAKIEQQGQAIEVYKAKEEVHKQDQVLDSEVDKQVDELREKVANEPPEEGAGIVAGKLNEYFGEDKK